MQPQIGKGMLETLSLNLSDVESAIEETQRRSWQAISACMRMTKRKHFHMHVNIERPEKELPLNGQIKKPSRCFMRTDLMAMKLIIYIQSKDVRFADYMF